jgi:hypothetical protein
MNRERCRPPLPAAEVKAIARSIGRYHPHADGQQAPAKPRSEPWRPVPLIEAAGSEPEVEAKYGRGLVYGAGATILLSSEPGVGKSMVIAALTVDVVLAGEVALYLDFERTPGLLLNRLKAFGLADEDLSRVFYLRPKEPDSPAGIRAMVEQIGPALAAVDSYDAALAVFGLETKNEDVRTFGNLVVDPLRSAGASCVLADHVPKDREKRGRYSIGGQAKLGLADAHLGLTALAPLRRGAEGKLKVKVLKDTYGLLPPAAVFTLRSNELTGALSWGVRVQDADAGDEATFRPTGLMERVSIFLGAGEAVSRNEVEQNVKGKDKYVRQAIDALVREGFAEEEDGPRGARLVRLIRPYREDDE